ncbi:MAG: hypothetical protein IPK87_03755 [Planctomycetes bacterium]|nr:hypothetical protein [Planctomycetota bacterium]
MEDKPRRALFGIVNLTPVGIAGATLVALAAIITGFWLDAQTELTQPMLFWPFVIFGLTGTMLGLGFGMRNDDNFARNLIASFGALLAWRFSYFPFMVVAGWKGSLGEAVTHGITGISVVYPFFIFFIFAQNLGIGVIASAAVAKPSGEPTKGRLQFVRNIVHKPPRVLLWLLAVVALPVAGMVSFSTSSDLVLFNDGPWAEGIEAPPIHDPETNPYTIIMQEHDLSVPAWVLAVNARVTYPLVPHSPWGSAMAGTLETLALENPTATTRDRIDEHYLAYMAAHARIHDANAGKAP